MIIMMTMDNNDGAVEIRDDKTGDQKRILIKNKKRESKSHERQ